MARAKAAPTAISDDDLLPEARPEEMAPESGLAVPRPIPVRWTVVGPTEATDEYDPGDILVHEVASSVAYDAAAFDRRFRVIQGEESESAYEERFPRFSTGGTAYVRVPCPNCAQTMIFSVEVGEALTMGDKSQLRPTFKVKAKEHFCGQISARLEDHEDADGPGDGVPDAGAETGAEDDGE